MKQDSDIKWVALMVGVYVVMMTVIAVVGILACHGKC